MAKKKRRRKPARRPAGAAATQTQIQERPAAERATSQRALRKEEARKERERRIRQARRQVRFRRAARWGIAVAIIGGIGGVITYRVVQDARLTERAATAASRLGCTPLAEAEQPDAGAGHTPPFAEGLNGVPATSGAHSSPLEPEPAVYDEPIPEENAVHNLEHGYVVIYYRAEGDGALSEEIRSELEDLAEGETKVLMAPYAGLANTLDLVAWRQLQTCDPPADADPGDAELVARAFVNEFRGGGLAPEASAP
ncbi:MAG: DUF3105 domain-containing protein [Actinomycetota bacterium]|jgi:hypothetical protein